MNTIANKTGGVINTNVSFIIKYKWALVVLVGAILTTMIYYYIKNKVIKNQQPNEYVPGESNNSKKEAEIILFYVDWCPHCKTAKPEWNKVKAQYDGKDINGYIVVFTEINCTEETPETEKMIATYKIEGYPTIKLLKENEVIEYDAKPKEETLVQFLNTVL